MYEHVDCMYVFVPCACPLPSEVRRPGSDPLGLESQMGVSDHVDAGSWKPMSSARAAGALTAEPSLQPLHHIYIHLFFGERVPGLIPFLNLLNQ